MWKQPVEFFKAAGLLGGGSVTLAIILFLITGFEHYWDHNVTATIFAVLGIIFFCVGAYAAWKREREKYETEVAKHGMPRFELNPGQLHLWFNAETNQTILLLSPTVTNHGATSAARHWQISYNSPMMQIVVPYSNLPDPVTRWILPTGDRALLLQNEKMLPFKTAQAVESGHSQSGRIVFEIPGNLVRDILTNPTQVLIGCLDRLNKVTWQGLTQANILSEFSSLPGEEFAPIEQTAPIQRDFDLFDPLKLLDPPR